MPRPSGGEGGAVARAMQTLAPVERWMAVLLAALAGYVDSIGFLQLGGLFVSFMSGNTTRMAAANVWPILTRAPVI